VYTTLQEQASGCESGLLRTLLEVAPEVMTQDDFDNYVNSVNDIRWYIHRQLKSYNEQAIVWILDARPDFKRKAEKKKGKLELPFPLRSGF